VFHPLKALLRKAAERTVNRLERCVRSFIRGLKPPECVGYLGTLTMIQYDLEVLVVFRGWNQLQGSALGFRH
jgi:hypothetical protein